jgi:hypothetical protein
MLAAYVTYLKASVGRRQHNELKHIVSAIREVLNNWYSTEACRTFIYWQHKTGFG